MFLVLPVLLIPMVLIRILLQRGDVPARTPIRSGTRSDNHPVLPLWDGRGRLEPRVLLPQPPGHRTEATLPAGAVLQHLERRPSPRSPTSPRTSSASAPAPKRSTSPLPSSTPTSTSLLHSTPPTPTGQPLRVLALVEALCAPPPSLSSSDSSAPSSASSPSSPSSLMSAFWDARGPAPHTSSARANMLLASHQDAQELFQLLSEAVREDPGAGWRGGGEDADAGAGTRVGEKQSRRTMTPPLEPEPAPVFHPLHLRPSRICPLLSVVTDNKVSVSPPPSTIRIVGLDMRAPSSLMFGSRSLEASGEDEATLHARTGGLPPVFTCHSRNHSSLLPDAPSPKSSQGSAHVMPLARAWDGRNDGRTRMSRMRSLNACADGMLIPDGVLYGVKGSKTEEDREVDMISCHSTSPSHYNIPKPAATLPGPLPHPPARKASTTRPTALTVFPTCAHTCP
ncbi:hypothetical protein B0H14DRAFT_3608633 [Mycena olivaceomarginata]|nr:hypothetical protein B0H14DRAFT_3608633 [Mycena olivaceomarginata]